MVWPIQNLDFFMLIYRPCIIWVTEERGHLASYQHTVLKKTLKNQPVDDTKTLHCIVSILQQLGSVVKDPTPVSHWTTSSKIWNVKDKNGVVVELRQCPGVAVSTAVCPKQHAWELDGWGFFLKVPRASFFICKCYLKYLGKSACWWAFAAFVCLYGLYCWIH